MVGGKKVKGVVVLYVYLERRSRGRKANERKEGK